MNSNTLQSDATPHSTRYLYHVYQSPLGRNCILILKLMQYYLSRYNTSIDTAGVTGGFKMPHSGLFLPTLIQNLLSFLSTYTTNYSNGINNVGCTSPSLYEFILTRTSRMECLDLISSHAIAVMDVYLSCIRVTVLSTCAIRTHNTSEENDMEIDMAVDADFQSHLEPPLLESLLTTVSKFDCIQITDPSTQLPVVFINDIGTNVLMKHCTVIK